MNDSDIENVLRKYRPGGPPNQLRQRIVRSEPRQSIRPWLAAAAVLILCVLTCRVAARREVSQVDLQLGLDANARVVDELTDILGGNAEARELAESMVMEAQVRADAMRAVDDGRRDPGERP
jgi:hypothetical protein